MGVWTSPGTSRQTGYVSSGYISQILDISYPGAGVLDTSSARGRPQHLSLACLINTSGVNGECDGCSDAVVRRFDFHAARPGLNRGREYGVNSS